MVKVGKIDEIEQYKLYKKLIKGRIIDRVFQNIYRIPELDEIIKTVYDERVDGVPLDEIESTQKFRMGNNFAKQIIRNLDIHNNPHREFLLESILVLDKEPTNVGLYKTLSEAVADYQDLKDIVERYAPKQPPVQHSLPLKQKTY